MRSELKRLIRFLALYGMLLIFILFLRWIHGLDINYHYYFFISTFVVVFIVIFSFIKPHHIEKILPEKWKITKVISLALVLEPLMERRISNIKETQEARGASFRGLKMIKGYLSLLIPSIVQTLRWSNNLTESLKMRGADAEKQ